MSFWVAAIVLTAVAGLAVLVPLSRRPGAHGAPTANVLEVYRDQLAELDRDAERGLIGAAESEEARAEIGRRILRIARDRATPQPPRRVLRVARGGATPQHARGAGLRASRVAALAAVLSVPLVSWGLYSLVG